MRAEPAQLAAAAAPPSAAPRPHRRGAPVPAAVGLLTWNATSMRSAWSQRRAGTQRTLLMHPGAVTFLARQ
eukprot:8033477-Lingulodinium_polyedra.AAC.1